MALDTRMSKSGTLGGQFLADDRQLGHALAAAAVASGRFTLR